MVKDLLGMDLAEIRDCLGPEAPPFRARQLFRAEDPGAGDFPTLK